MNRNMIEMLGRAVLDMCLWGLALASFLPFVGKLHWRIDLFSHFRVQYFFGLAILAPAAVLMGDRRRAAAALAFALLNAALIVPLFRPPAPPGTVPLEQAYRLLVANVNVSNRSFGAVRSLIDETDPDFILLFEIDQGWLDGLALDDLGYAHRELRPQADNFGAGLFSRHPFDSSGILADEQGQTAGVIARVVLEGRLLNLIGIHPPPPVTAAAAARREVLIRDAFGMAAGLGGTTILAGDFNASTWSYALAEPLAAGGLRDSRPGFGIQSTWPASWPAVLRIPIDHVFATADVRILARAVGPLIGSDHLPLWVNFSITDNLGDP